MRSVLFSAVLSLVLAVVIVSNAQAQVVYSPIPVVSPPVTAYYGGGVTTTYYAGPATTVVGAPSVVPNVTYYSPAPASLTTSYYAPAGVTTSYYAPYSPSPVTTTYYAPPATTTYVPAATTTTVVVPVRYYRPFPIRRPFYYVPAP